MDSSNFFHGRGTPWAPSKPRQDFPTYRPGQLFLTWLELYKKYSPPNSPRLGMPSVRRTLFVEDLHRRFHKAVSRDNRQSPNPSENGSSSSTSSSPSSPSPSPSGMPGKDQPRKEQIQNEYLAASGQDSPAPSVSSSSSSSSSRFSSPSPTVRSRRVTLRDANQSPSPPSSRPSSPPASARNPLSPRLSTKLPDPPIFKCAKDDPKRNVVFDDWKLRITDKLTHNGDHFPTESFKIAYIITRLGGEIIKYISLRRRLRPYTTVDELLGHLSDIYEIPTHIIRSENRYTLRSLRQGTQSFQTFYAEFMRCHEREEPYSDEDLIWNMKEAIRLRLRRCAVSNTDEFKSFTAMKEYLIRVDHEKRLMADKRADKRAIKKA